MKEKRFVQFAWFVLAYNVLVVLWGAFVRATGSGAGCGAHWPICNGQVIPRNPAVETMIEFSHRLSSGLALIFVVALIVWAFRLYPKGDKVRFATGWAMFFMITESLVGASLVLFRWVEANDSVARVYVMGIHLGNTFMLLFFLALAAFYASGRAKVRFRHQGRAGTLCWLSLLAMLLLAVSGAIIALGDSLVYIEGLSPDDSLVVATLMSIRIYHPLFAILVSVFLLVVSRYLAKARPSPQLSRASLILLILVLIEVVVGIINIALKVPVAVQIIHLLVASLMWLTVTFMTFFALSDDAERVPAVTM
ncbi:MAG TPA: heme A synthase [Caldilineae bacterium]|nr:heme A synthase [Caldilineae bacterium]